MVEVLKDMVAKRGPRPAEEPVLRVYKKVNPSATRVEDPESWQKYSTRIERRFMFEYKLPSRLFEGARVLDVGCGTGEKSLVFASWGATVTGIDYNERALKRARYLASISSAPKNLTFYRATLPDLPPAIAEQRFDFVHADGVLHHTTDPERTLQNIAARVIDGGWLIVRNYQTITSLQRILKRLLVRLGGDDDDAQIAANTERLFAEELQRSVEKGGRTTEQALYDNFINPRYNPFDLSVPFEICQRLGFVFYSQTPSSDSPLLVGPDVAYPTDKSLAKEMNSINQGWWSAVLARAALTTEPASVTLAEDSPLLEKCLFTATGLEKSVKDLMEQPNSQTWSVLNEALAEYLAASRTLVANLNLRFDNQVVTFLTELQKLRPIVAECLDKGIALEELPEMSVLFRGMSGFPMSSWVLWRQLSETSD